MGAGTVNGWEEPHRFNTRLWDLMMIKHDETMSYPNAKHAQPKPNKNIYQTTNRLISSDDDPTNKNIY